MSKHLTENIAMEHVEKGENGENGENAESRENGLREDEGGAVVVKVEY